MKFWNASIEIVFFWGGTLKKWIQCFLKMKIWNKDTSKKNSYLKKIIKKPTSSLRFIYEKVSDLIEGWEK